MQALSLYLQIQKEETSKLQKKSLEAQAVLSDVREKSENILKSISNLNPQNYPAHLISYIYERRQSLYELYELSLKAVQDQTVQCENLKKELVAQCLKEKQIETLLNKRIAQEAHLKSKQDRKVEDEIAVNLFLRKDRQSNA